MKFLFTKLEAIVAELNRSFLAPEPNADLITELLRETNCIKNELKEIFFQSWSSRDFENFTAMHHLDLLNMITRLHKRIEREIAKRKTGGENTGTTAIRLGIMVPAFCLLRGLLNFLHQHFDKYIPKNQKIPACFTRQMVKEMREFQQYISGKLVDIDPRLVELVLKPFVNFVELEQGRTWHHLFYCRLLHAEFSKLVRDQSSIELKHILYLLFYLNYNSTGFYCYCIQLIREDTQYPDINRLYYFQKLVRQVVVRVNVAYATEKPPLTEQVENWLKEEIRFLKRTGGKSLKVEPPKYSQNEGLAVSRFVTSFSAAKLAYKLKVDVKTGALKVDNYEEFFKLVSDTYSTSNATELSPKSLKNKYYSPESTAKEALLSYYTECIDFIKSDF